METYQKWLNSSALTDAEKAELTAIAGDEKEIESRFFGQLEFGTAGLRGTMGMGINRMNLYVVRHATQAFAEVILAEGEEAAKRGVAICFDCRNNSDLFARAAACVMAANGIPVRLFEGMRPTPELSFAVREYGCIAGINVTASHNPKEYNGYKVYWADGAQLPPRHANEVAAKMAVLDLFDDVKVMDYDTAVAAGLITILGKDTDEAFLSNVMGQLNDADAIAKVANDNLQILIILAQNLCCSLGNIGVAGAVEAVSSHLVLLIVLVGKCIEVCVVGHSLVESRVEDRDLRNTGHKLLACADTREVCGVVKRAELAALFDSLDDLFVNDNRA